ncbi:MAG: sigma-70 family RNA polymerase sigma factor, partial [Eubacterium sp.]|nr:sigma-70 family RNA polymerase sigma factor [Eubacterium sp.]
QQLLDELESKERELIELRYFEDKTQMQVAEALQMNQVQVSRMEKKILKTMRKKVISIHE